MNNPLSSDRTSGDPTTGEALHYRASQKHKRKFWEHHNKSEYSCPECGADGPLHVHHIDGNPGNGSLENLRALCQDCHWEHHRQTDYPDESDLDGWKRWFEEEFQ